MSDSDPRPQLPTTLEWQVIPERKRRLTRRGLLVGTLGLSATGGVVWAAGGVLQGPSFSTLPVPTGTAAPQAAAVPLPTGVPSAPTNQPTLAVTSASAATATAVPPTAIPTATTAATLVPAAVTTSEPVASAASAVVVAAETAGTATSVPPAHSAATLVPARDATVAPAVIGGPVEQMVLGQGMLGADVEVRYRQPDPGGQVAAVRTATRYAIP